MNTHDSNVKKLIDQILAIIPGTNCGGHGGCGKPTCEECAAEIAETQNITLCPACSQNDVDKIAETLGVESEEIRKRVAFIACAGRASGMDRFAENEHCTSCGQAKDLGFERGECKYGCLGLGSCIPACTFDAIVLKDGQISINRDKCNGCGACASEEFCVQGLISMIPADATNFIPCSSQEKDEDKVREICGYGCIGCGECEIVCPEGAVKIIDNHAVIDYDKCVGCVACTVRCKKKIIVDTLHDLAVEKDKVAFVKCSGGERAAAAYKNIGTKTCKEAATSHNARDLGVCTAGCVGLGDCTKVCRYDAIHMVDGTAFVDSDKCVGCKDCVLACPKNIIEIVEYKGAKMVPCSSIASYDEKVAVCASACIGCETCKDNCPSKAIYMEDNHAVVDIELCENCRICQYVCPKDIIHERRVPEFLYLQDEALDFRRGE